MLKSIKIFPWKCWQTTSSSIDTVIIYFLLYFKLILKFEMFCPSLMRRISMMLCVQKVFLAKKLALPSRTRKKCLRKRKKSHIFPSPNEQIYPTPLNASSRVSLATLNQLPSSELLGQNRTSKRFSSVTLLFKSSTTRITSIFFEQLKQDRKFCSD